MKQYDEGFLRIKDEEVPKFASFFMKNAESSLQAASILHEISDQQALKSTLQVTGDFESYLWVIVSSDYSIFYVATALLASQGVRVTWQIVHKVTGDALLKNLFTSSRGGRDETTKLLSYAGKQLAIRSAQPESPLELKTSTGCEKIRVG